jgi:hypothetical protein
MHRFRPATPLALLLTLFADHPALAAGIQDAGKNAGEMMTSWARPLYGGSAAIVAAFFVLTRDWAKAVAFVALAMLVGGFVFAPATMGQISEGLWKTLLG